MMDFCLLRFLFDGISTLVFTCSDAEDVTSPHREAAASPARVASPMDAPAPPQPETTPTTPAPSLDKAVATANLAASSSRPATWEEHVSVSLQLFMYSVGFCILMSCFAAVWSCFSRGWQNLLWDGAGERRAPWLTRVRNW